jgi:predicted RNA methylase
MNAHPHSAPLEIESEAPALPKAAGFAQRLMKAAKTLVPMFEAGKPIDAATLRAAMEDAFDASDANGAWVWKDAYEAAEIAQIQMLSRYGALMQRQAASPQALLAMIERLAGLAPSHTRRSEDSIRLQQFSTPLPLAAIVARAAGFRADDLVLEPSAGTGMLAVFARVSGMRLALNELAETRRALLGLLFPEAIVSGYDAASIDDRLDRSITPYVIVMNPPFSAANHVEGRFRHATSQHVLSALARLAPGGRLVVITGESFRPSTKSFQPTFQRIGESADVVFSAAIDGKVFARHGTTIDTRLTVIDKRVGCEQGTAPIDIEAAYHPLCATTADLLSAVLTHCPARRNPPPCPTGAALSVPNRPTRTNLHALRNAARLETRALAADRAKHPFDDIGTAPLDYLPKAWSEPDGALQDTVYEAYDLQAIRIDGAAEHPTALVQSAAMASVPPPVPTYRPILPKSLVADGLLSAPQLESVIYAGNAHETHLKGWFKRGEIEGQLMAAAEGDEGAFRLRKGWFLGDGTGCGKGRQVAGIILDNWLQGRRRAVWVSKSDKLIEDARRDWIALGGRESDIVPLSKFRQGGDIRLPEGILFVTYATLRSAEREGKAARLDQVMSWLGEGFDGVIAFDESHAMANAAGEKSDRGDKKASQQGLAGLALQNAVPDARVLYVSATGATVVGNLAYASRLGLWGTGDFPFVTRAEFVAAMEAGGIAAIEMISRDLKALGLYLARSLSYAGVEYEMLVHELTPAQVAIYDSYADAYQIIHNNLEAALQASGISSDTGTLNAQAKSAARSAFESNKQRFFNHLITAMKCPSLIRSIEADLAEGNSAVIQVVSTSEAVMERRLEDIPPSDWDDLQVDFTPRENIMDYLMHSFPTQLFEPYTDENGDLRSRPALDGDGNPIICREAERRRDDLVEHLGALAPVQGALDQILWHFGGDAVAEVTGRKRRIVKTREGRLKVENRPASSNLGETQAFMDDAKRILIFSDAGGTGRSYHADLGAKNQRLRVHYLLEPGWKADNAIQGLGRTNRTNQAQPPLFRPVATDVKGEKRFLSTIARRLDTLGAITKGQRETGGQNMFRAEDNLESPYARAALRQFFYKLRAGKIEACSYAKFQEMTGLTLDEADGTMKENLPPIQQFLNRCLALRIDMQDAIFEAFGGFLSAIIEDARQAGTLDVGLETLRAEKFEIVDRKVIFEHEATGATATALTVERTDRNDPLTLPRVKSICANTDGATLCWNTTSKRAALMVKAPAFMDEDGVPILRVKLLRPMATEILALSEFSNSHWEEIDDAMFEHLWQAEVDAVPKFTTSKITLICGLLLPIWDRLPADNMRIYRLQTEDGERAIGRLVSQEQLLNVYARLGLDCQIEMTPQEVFAAIMDARTTLSLLGGYQLRRSLVMGQPRLELVGASSAALPGLKAMGCFTEVIQWKTRVFIPVDGADVLARVLAEHPVGASAADAAA